MKSNRERKKKKDKCDFMANIFMDYIRFIFTNKVSFVKLQWTIICLMYLSDRSLIVTYVVTGS